MQRPPASASDPPRTDDAFNAMLDRLEAEADAGAFLCWETMAAWFEALDADPDHPPPRPDVFLR